jgi:hypothetical protein
MMTNPLQTHDASHLGARTLATVLVIIMAIMIIRDILLRRRRSRA